MTRRRTPAWTRAALSAGTTLVVAGALLVPTTGTAAAGTASSGPLTVTVPDQYLRYGCHDYPITYSVDSFAPDWTLEVEVLLPSGEPTDSDIAFGSWSASGRLDAFLCDLLDGPGRYEVRATLVERDEWYRPIGTATVSTTFRLLRSGSRTTLRASRTRVRPGQRLTLNGRVVAANGPYAGRPAGSERVTLQVRTKRGWEGQTVYTDRRGRYRLRLGRVNPKRKVTRLRAVFTGSSVLAPSRSKVVRVRRVG